MYLAAQAIPRLYAQELMRVSAVIGASAGSTSMVRLEEGQVCEQVGVEVEEGGYLVSHIRRLIEH